MNVLPYAEIKGLKALLGKQQSNPEMGLRLEYFMYPQFITTNLHVQCCRMQLPLTVIFFDI